MRKIKMSVAALLVLVLAFGLCACGGSKGSADTTSDSASEPAASQEFDNTKKLTVVTEATFMPFEFYEDGSDEIQGFDVDMMNAIAEMQGLDIEFVNMEFDALIPALESNQGDIICAGMNKLAGDRAQKADFGETYFESDLRVLVRTDSELEGHDALTSEMKVASQIGTTGAEYAQEMADNGEIAGAVILNQWTDCYMQLQNGDVDAVFVDQPVGNAYLNKHSDIAKFAGDTFGDHEEFAFAVQKGNKELLDLLNEGLQKLKDEGTFDELVDKWFS